MSAKTLQDVSAETRGNWGKWLTSMVLPEGVEKTSSRPAAVLSTLMP
jgi:hypothetical protein